MNMLMPHITQKYKDNLDATRNANHSLAVFIKVSNDVQTSVVAHFTSADPDGVTRNLFCFSYFHCTVCISAIAIIVLSDLINLWCLYPQRCFTFMDRGFAFKQINNYINCFMPGDARVPFSDIFFDLIFLLLQT